MSSGDSLAQAPAVLVTGVSSGIGEAIAQGLLAQGWRVFGSVRRAEDAQALAGRHGDAFVPLVFDVTDSEGLARAAAQVQAAVGARGLQGLVNNAGISHAGPLVLQPLAEIRHTFEVNVFALLAVTRAFLPLLGMRADASAPAGRVVNIGSVSGAITVPFMASYSAAKHAVEALSQGLRRELTPYGIEVSTIEPSFIRSRLFEKSARERHQDSHGYARSSYSAAWQAFSAALVTQEDRAKPPDIVVRAVLHALQAPRPRTRYPLDPVWHLGRVLPDRLFDRLIFKALGLSAHLRR